jgi:hexaprenyl-diphosphate synthase
MMAKGARSAVVLGGSREGEIWKEIAYAYGRNLGIAFQVRLTLLPGFSFLKILD